MSLLSNDQKILIDKALQLHKEGKLQEAIKSYSELLDKEKNNSQLLFLIGTAFVQIKDYNNGINYLKKSLSFKPNNASAYSNLGNAYKELRLYDEALENYNEAIRVNPNLADAYNNRGIILQEMKLFDDALKSYDKAIQIKPDHFFSYNNRGITLKSQNRFEEALKSYDQAIKIKPNFVEAYNNRGNIFKDLKDYKKALENFQKIMELNKSYSYNLGKVLHFKMFLSDWSDFHSLKKEIENLISRKKKVIEPFSFLGLSDDPASSKIVSETFINDKFSQHFEKKKPIKIYNHEKLKIGYVSGDFHDHPVLHLITDVFKNHDKTKFDLFAFSYGPIRNDKWRNEVKKYFLNFEDINKLSDKNVADLIKKNEIDIIIDLSGLTGNSRSGIFSYRAAPIQINYLGYPGTTGATYMDFIIADEIVIPKENFKHYTEKVLYLPHCYQANMSQREISKKQFKRIDFGLPEDSFIYCSFNNNYKITPDIFDTWMNILKKVDNSVLWILKSNEIASKNLKKEAEKKGIDEGRIIFADFLPNDEHLKRISLADVFLDTYPYNAHTTASDAIRMGIPIITLTGNSFASRVGASILSSVNIKELITYNQKDYEEVSISLGMKPEKLLAIKSKLKENLVKAPLFNSIKFTKNLEELYLKISKN